MPKKEQIITVNDWSTQQMHCIILKSVLELDWQITFADATQIVAQTTPNAIKGTQITFKNDGTNLQITSEQVNGEILDLGNRNQKSITAFLEKFRLNKNFDEDALTNYQHKLQEYQEATVIAVEQQNKEIQEVDNAMNLSNSNLYATYAIIAINTIVFILMVINGAGVIDANGYVHLKWGSNYGPLTLSGDWWRLITATFIHFGVIHIAMNMYSLYSVGIYLEPMLGKVKYIVAYLCTGVVASIVSLWWHTSPTNSAGASGAVFGMYGLFLAFLISNIIPKIVREALLKSIGIFVFYNLVYGMKSGIDNAAHVGGLVSGFVIGYIFVLARKKESKDFKMNWLAPVIAIFTIVLTFFYLQKNKNDGKERASIIDEINSHSGNYKDLDKYDIEMNNFAKLEENAVTFLDDTTLSDDDLKNKIETIALPNWQKTNEIVAKINKYDVSPALLQRAKILGEYVGFRIKESNAMLQYLSGKNAEIAIDSLNDARKNISLLVEQLTNK
jgi:rhomboid protease GluP